MSTVHVVAFARSDLRALSESGLGKGEGQASAHGKGARQASTAPDQGTRVHPDQAIEA
jgi:hypothetical protein